MGQAVFDTGINTTDAQPTGLGVSKSVLFQSSGAVGQTEQSCVSILVPCKKGTTYSPFAEFLILAGFNGIAGICINWYQLDGVTLSAITPNAAFYTPDYRSVPASIKAIVAVGGTAVAPSDAAFAQVYYFCVWPTGSASAGATYGSYGTVPAYAPGIVNQAPAATDTTIQSGATKNVVTVGPTAPTSPAPTNGDLWKNTSITPPTWNAYESGTWVLCSTVGGDFSSNLYESTGGSAATLANFKTILGVASGITGQAPAATDTTIQTGATKNVVTISTTAPGSPTAGDLWNDISTTPATWKAYEGGAWQLCSTVGGVFSSNLYETLGGSAATLANFKTILGVASSVTGQAPAATDSTIQTGATKNVVMNVSYSDTGSYTYTGGSGALVQASTYTIGNLKINGFFLLTITCSWLTAIGTDQLFWELYIQNTSGGGDGHMLASGNVPAQSISGIHGLINYNLLGVVTPIPDPSTVQASKDLVIYFRTLNTANTSQFGDWGPTTTPPSGPTVFSGSYIA